jgi:hypothetical protein
MTSRSRRVGSASAVVLVLAVVAVAGASCGSSGSTPLVGLSAGCSLNSDCDNPLICVFSRCHAACNDSADCMPGERCVPAGGDAGAVNVCQLPGESQCGAGSLCLGGEVCGSDDQCRAPCQTSANCLSMETCLTIGGAGGACYDPNDAYDKTALAAADGGPLDASMTLSDATPSGDAPVDAPFAPNPEAGPLGFTPSNFTLTGLDAGQGVDAGASDVMVTQTCTDSNCLPAPATILTNSGTSAALYVFNSLTVVQSAALRFTGTLPVIVVVQTTANIQGQILVNGADTTAGPGGFFGANAGAGSGQPGFSPGFPASASGGAGYCGTGGNGAATSPPVATGGMPYGSPTIVPLIGGSAGGAENGSSSGPGGGAIEIVAGQGITVGAFGAINAGGGGGGGYANAGGGGSGGAILLEAPVVTVSGTLAANGGGGGQSEGSPISGVGSDATANAQPAPGFDGIGGSGSAAASVNGSSGLSPDAGNGVGAGGGGAGRIRINTASGSASITGTVSPALSTPCATQGTLGP